MTLESFLRRVVAIVDQVGIPYMLTGSLASAYYGEPRATRDIDYVIVVSDLALDQLVRGLDEGWSSWRRRRVLLGEARRISESEAPGDIDNGPGSLG